MRFISVARYDGAECSTVVMEYVIWFEIQLIKFFNKFLCILVGRVMIVVTIAFDPLATLLRRHTTSFSSVSHVERIYLCFSSDDSLPDCDGALFLNHEDAPRGKFAICHWPCQIILYSFGYVSSVELSVPFTRVE